MELERGRKEKGIQEEENMESFKELRRKLAEHTEVRLRDPDGTIDRGKILDTVTARSSKDNPFVKTIYVLQKIQFENRRKPLLRFGYYITGKKGNVKGRWVWGQFSPIISPEDFKKLLSRAEKRGMI